MLPFHFTGSIDKRTFKLGRSQLAAAEARRGSGRQGARLAVRERDGCALEPDTRPGRALAISVQRVIATLVPAEGHLRISGAAAALGLSVRTLQRRLAQEGLRFEELLQADRLAKATRLLDTTSATVLEIALALGYSDHAHFTRAFRRWQGIPPLSYRRSSMSRGHSHADVHARDQYAP
jgi:AraC-like DNA-binding protein